MAPGGVTNLYVAGLVLREKPVMAQLLNDKLTPTYISETNLFFEIPGRPGEFFARTGAEMVDTLGKPAPGLEGWKLVLVTNRFAAFEKGEERTFVRWKRE